MLLTTPDGGMMQDFILQSLAGLEVFLYSEERIKKTNKHER